MSESQDRICSMELDESTISRRGTEIDHERKVAMFELTEDNYFRLLDDDKPGPYHVKLSMVEKRLIFDVSTEAKAPLHTFILSLTPLRRVIKDYFDICDSYFAAIKTSTAAQIEAIDMGRRGLHNEGSQILRERLEGKVDTDLSTARRLFTLICSLHLRM